MTGTMKMAHHPGILDGLDGTGSDVEWATVEELRRNAGDQLPTMLLEKYRSSATAAVRASCVFHATRYSRAISDAVALGLEALGDRSKVVRYRACLLLAYSQQTKVLPALRAALARAPVQSKADVLAAIDAIENRNHHYFVDRDHSGKVKLNVN